MATSFDLNIKNYTRDELIDMFQLPYSFDPAAVEIKRAMLQKNILSSQNMSQNTAQIVHFLSQAAEIINQKQHTIPASGPNELRGKISDFYNTSYELKPVQIVPSGDHMVQDRKEQPFLSSFPSEFFPGVINPLKKRTIRKNLNIDTRFRDNYYASSATNFNIFLPMQFTQVIQMQLASIEFPATIFAISKQYGNNYFTASITDTADTTTSAVIYIPDGNYTPYTITSAINHALSLQSSPLSNIVFQTNLAAPSAGSGVTPTGGGQMLVGVADDQTANYTSISLDFQQDIRGFSDRNTPLPLKLGWMLGFRNGAYVGNLNYVSEGIIDVKGPKYLFLVVDDFNNNVNNGFYSAFSSSILNKNILARISMQTSTNTATTPAIVDQTGLNLTSTPREYFGPVTIQSMQIQLLDEYGRVVNLNNMDYSFCLILTTMYDV